MPSLHSLFLQAGVGVDRFSGDPGQLSVDVEGEGTEALDVHAASCSQVVI